MLTGKFKVSGALSKLNPQLHAADMLKIEELKKSVKYSNWNELFVDFLYYKGIEVPAEILAAVGIGSD